MYLLPERFQSKESKEPMAMKDRSPVSNNKIPTGGSGSSVT